MSESDTATMLVDCPDCHKDWGHSYCGTCGGVGKVRRAAPPQAAASASPATSDAWPGYENLIRWVKTAPRSMRGAILFAAVESCLDGQFFASDESLQAAVGNCVRTAKLSSLLATYADLVNQFGAESEETAEFVAAHADDPEFVELAETSKQLKLALTSRGQ